MHVFTHIEILIRQQVLLVLPVYFSRALPWNLLLLGHLIHLCISGYTLTFMVCSLFPIKQKPCTSSSGQPVSEVLWNVTQTPREHRKGRLPASACSSLFAPS